MLLNCAVVSNIELSYHFRFLFCHGKQNCMDNHEIILNLCVFLEKVSLKKRILEPLKLQLIFESIIQLARVAGCLRI